MSSTLPPNKTLAAQYVRMSTEHQQYSTSNQEDMIREYAAERSYEIVRTYADAGKSGLDIAGRKSLRQLLDDVQAGNPGYSAILVYDVTRWGRFQDADESAYYEYLCKRAGVEVHYCTEKFENDGGPTSTIIKSVKRAMAGEYSRELSSKVFKGQCRLIQLGYRQGGAAGYGLRRMLVNRSGEAKGELARGEYKSQQTDRIILVAGPDHELTIIQRIYRRFIDHGLSESEIATELNSEGIVTDVDRPWTRDVIQQVLTNEKYIGNNVFNRDSFKLKKKRVKNDPEMWIRKDRAFPSIVTTEQFLTARAIFQERNRRLTDEDMLTQLRMLAAETNSLSARLIDATHGMPSSTAYLSRFGSLLNAYQLAGCIPLKKFERMATNRRIRSLKSPIVADLMNRLIQVGATVSHDTKSGFLLINDEYSAQLILSKCQKTPAGSLRWHIQCTGQVAPDITILGRMDESNDHPVDYYLLPLMDVSTTSLFLCETNGVHLETYQFESLDFFTKLAARRRIEVAA